jgi:cysteinyl-tRNA synthetase
MASVWMHNGFLQVEGQKMSKSAGNFFTIQDVLKDWPGEVVRLNMLKTHYRQPIDWTVSGLKESESMLKKWNNIAIYTEKPPSQAFINSIMDDLNISIPIAEMHKMHKSKDAEGLGSALKFLGLSRQL